MGVGPEKHLRSLHAPPHSTQLCRGVLRNNSPPAAGGGRWHCVWGKGSGERRSSPSSPGRPQDRGVGQRVPQGRPLWPRHPSCVVFARPEEPAALPALGIVPGRRPWELRNWTEKGQVRGRGGRGTPLQTGTCLLAFVWKDRKRNRIRGVWGPPCDHRQRGDIIGLQDAYLLLFPDVHQPPRT